VKSEIVYVELKTGYSDNGPAWIGVPSYSKSRATIYFNGMALKSLKGSGISGNYYNSLSGDEYWVSGIKRDGKDRHWAGGGKVLIDKSAVNEYLSIIGKSSLPRNIVPTELKPSIPSAKQHESENKPLDEKQEDVLGRRPISKVTNMLKKNAT